MDAHDWSSTEEDTISNLFSYSWLAFCASLSVHRISAWLFAYATATTTVCKAGLDVFGTFSSIAALCMSVVYNRCVLPILRRFPVFSPFFASSCIIIYLYGRRVPYSDLANFGNRYYSALEFVPLPISEEEDDDDDNDRAGNGWLRRERERTATVIEL